MNNSEVRKHLRKGELAVAVLESLGYTYKDRKFDMNEWTAPPPKEVPVDPSIKLNADFCEELQGLLKKHKMVGHAPSIPSHVQVPDVEVGDQFLILNVPGGHYFKGMAFHGHRWEVTDLSYIAKDSEASVKLKNFVGWAVGYNYQAWNQSEPRKLWLPLSCIRLTRKHGGPRNNADF